MKTVKIKDATGKVIFDKSEFHIMLNNLKTITINEIPVGKHGVAILTGDTYVQPHIITMMQHDENIVDGQYIIVKMMNFSPDQNQYEKIAAQMREELRLNKNYNWTFELHEPVLGSVKINKITAFNYRTIADMYLTEFGAMYEQLTLLLKVEV